MPKISFINPVTAIDIPFNLQKDEEYSITLQKNEYIALKIRNPNGAKVSCTVEKGAGEVLIKKNNRWIGSSYFLSIDSLYPTNVEFNTNTTSPEDVERANNETVIAYDKAKFATKYSVAQKDINNKFLRNKLALEYGVRGADISFQPTKTNVRLIAIKRDNKEIVIVNDKAKFAAQYGIPELKITDKYLENKLALEYGVGTGDITIKRATYEGGLIIIPDSIWELNIEPSGSDENTFKVKLIDPYTPYIIQEGDTLASIANKYRTNIKDLRSLNPNVDPNILYVGQVIKVS